MSTIRADNIGPSAGGTVRELVRGTAAAWANLNGTETIELRDSANMSSLLDNGTGDYTVNFTNVMSNSNYSVSGIGQRSSSSDAIPPLGIRSAAGTPATGSVRIGCRDVNSTYVDMLVVSVQVFGSLA